MHSPVPIEDDHDIELKRTEYQIKLKKFESNEKVSFDPQYDSLTYLNIMAILSQANQIKQEEEE